MARTSKPSSVRKGKDLNKEELLRRQEIEERLMGNSEQIDKIPEDLNDISKIYYKWLVQELKVTGILSNIDIPLLEQTSTCLYIIRECVLNIDKFGILVNGEDKYGNPLLKENPALKTHKDYLTKYTNLANQLGLSPAARASLAQKKIEDKEKQEDPLLKILRGEE